MKKLRKLINKIFDAIDSPYTCKRCDTSNCHPETCNCKCHR